jgi:hypothetical protein
MGTNVSHAIFLVVVDGSLLKISEYEPDAQRHHWQRTGGRGTWFYCLDCSGADNGGMKTVRDLNRQPSDVFT